MVYSTNFSNFFSDKRACCMVRCFTKVKIIRERKEIDMGHTRNSIIINAPYDLVFDISNKIERWTELFGKEYVKAEVLNFRRIR